MQTINGSKGSEYSSLGQLQSNVISLNIMVFFLFFCEQVNLLRLPLMKFVKQQKNPERLPPEVEGCGFSLNLTPKTLLVASLFHLSPIMVLYS